MKVEGVPVLRWKLVAGIICTVAGQVRCRYVGKYAANLLDDRRGRKAAPGRQYDSAENLPRLVRISLLEATRAPQSATKVNKLGAEGSTGGTDEGVSRLLRVEVRLF